MKRARVETTEHGQTFRGRRGHWLAALLLVSSMACAQPGAGNGQAGDPASPPRRTHLILKDGSYQVVTSYRVVGANVVYRSAERGGAEEVVPVALVDLDATHRWEQRHGGGTAAADGQQSPPAIDPELLKEEADRAAMTPEVAPDLSLPQQGGVVALDTFQGSPELVPMPQNSGELNRTTGHSFVRSVLNPRAAPHAILTLKGERAVVQLHVDTPAFFVRLGGDDSFTPTGGGPPLTVDTHGASSGAPAAVVTADSRYAIVRTDVRTAARVIDSFSLDPARPGEDTTWTATQVLPGGHWLKMTPKSPLAFGEYALVEVLSDREINLNVWDFGVHPAAGDNRDAFKPEPKRRIGLETRPRE